MARTGLEPALSKTHAVVPFMILILNYLFTFLISLFILFVQLNCTFAIYYIIHNKRCYQNKCKISKFKFNVPIAFADFLLKDLSNLSKICFLLYFF